MLPIASSVSPPVRLLPFFPLKIASEVSVRPVSLAILKTLDNVAP